MLLKFCQDTTKETIWSIDKNKDLYMQSLVWKQLSKCQCSCGCCMQTCLAHSTPLSAEL